MFSLIKRMIFGWCFKRAVRMANRLASETGMRYYVLNIGGNLRVVPKRNIAELIARRVFRKGTKPSDIEKIALHVTPLTSSGHVRK